VPNGVQTATTNALAQSGITSVAGTASTSSGSSSSSASGTIITATGSSIPNYDPSLSVTYAGFHQTSRSRTR